MCLRLQQKREKRVIANWTLLVKGLLIRERLKRRYGQQNLTQQRPGVGQGEEDGLSSEDEAEERGGPSTNPPALASSWPQNRQEEPEETAKQASSKRAKRGQQKHLFPFEKVWNSCLWQLWVSFRLRPFVYLLSVLSAILTALCFGLNHKTNCNMMDYVRAQYWKHWIEGTRFFMH